MAAGHAAVRDGLRVCYLSAAELIESLYRGLADNSVGKIIDSLLRFDLVIVDELGFAPLDDHGTQLLFRFVAAAYERRSLGIASHWPFEQLSLHHERVRALGDHHRYTAVAERMRGEMIKTRPVHGGIPISFAEVALADDLPMRRGEDEFTRRCRAQMLAE